MAVPILVKSQKNQPMHQSVGGIIKIKNKYLLIDRAIFPFGFACPAGHVDEGETPHKALKREVKEETGLDVMDCELIHEEEKENNVCSRGVSTHYWRIYECKAKGALKPNLREVKSIGWYGADDIKNLVLEPVWEDFFKKLKIL